MIAVILGTSLRQSHTCSFAQDWPPESISPSPSPEAMSRVFRALQPFQRSIAQPQVRAFSEGAGPDLGGRFMTGMGAAAFSHCQKYARKYARRLFAPAGPTPSQQLSQYAYHKTIDSKPVAPQVVSQMEMVGMNEFMAVQCMVVPKDLLREKVHVGLTAKGVPNKVAQAISFELDGASCFQMFWDDFQVEDGTGSAHSYRVIVRMSESDGHCDVAIAASGASFNAAKEVSHYETQEILGQTIACPFVHVLI